MPRGRDRTPIGDPNDARGFDVLLARYLEWRAVHGYSPRSRRMYRWSLRQFGAWCLERALARPDEVTRSAMERYQRWLYHYRRPDGRALAVRTQIARLAHVRSFFKWLAKERYLLYDPAANVEMPKAPVRLPVEGFSVAEVEEVLAVPDVTQPLGLRNRAILEVLYSTGMRRMELVNLDVYDIDFDRGRVAIRQGKGGRDRVVPIGDRALAWLRRYLEDVRAAWVLHADERALFVSHEGVRFSAGGLGHEVAKILKQSTVRPRLGACHLFRHTMATLMLEGGADVRYVQEMLGHAKLETTQLYTRVSIEKLKQIHQATHPASTLAGAASPDRHQAGE